MSATLRSPAQWQRAKALARTESKTDERDGVDGARTGISLNEELCQDGCR